MNDGPIGGKDGDEIPLQFQGVEAPHPRTVHVLEPAVHHQRLNVEQLATPPIDNAELKAGLIAIGRDQR